MERECPFWAQQRLCNSNKCGVCECEDKDVPKFWKKAQDEDQTSMGQHKHSLWGKKAKKEEWCQTVEDL